jgi:hypothetical protein
MRKVVYLFTVILIAVSLFLYMRFKTKRIDHMIGYNQTELEQQINYPNNHTQLEEVDISKLDNDILEIIMKKGLDTEKPILRYTLSGSVRKSLFWLIDEGTGYKVIEALDTNL